LYGKEGEWVSRAKETDKEKDESGGFAEEIEERFHRYLSRHVRGDANVRKGRRLTSVGMTKFLGLGKRFLVW
jgi:hypothetical protein